MATFPSEQQLTSTDCEDPIPQKGMVSVMSAYVYVQRNLLLTYVDSRNRAQVFNSDDYYNYSTFDSNIIVDWMYYALIRPGYQHVFSTIQNELLLQNTNRINTMTIALAVYIIFSTLFLALVWIPFIFSNQHEVSGDMELMVDNEAATVGEHPAGASDIEDEKAERVIRADHVQAQGLSC